MKDIIVLIPKHYALGIYIEGGVFAVSSKPTINNICKAIKEHYSLDEVIFNPKSITPNMRAISWADSVVDIVDFTFFQKDGMDEDFVECLEINFELIELY